MRKQKLLTKEIMNRMPFYKGQDGKGKDAIVHLKLFNPYGTGTWLITEGWQLIDDGSEDYRNEPLKYIPKLGEKVVDIILYGYCHIYELELGNVWEWGNVSLNEVEYLGKIEREKYESNGKYTVSQLCK